MSAHELFAAAREDGPSDASHEQMWTRVAAVTGVAAGATGTASAASGGMKAAISAKVLAIGGLIGAAGTALGVVVATTVVTPPAASAVEPPGAEPATTRVARTSTGGARLAESPPRRLDPATYLRAPEPSATAVTAVTAARAANPASDLATEAGLITAARTALVAGDASRALVLVRTTRQLPTRALLPESLSLEARALQALGRADEAAAVELALRRAYPDHALAR
jgi:hypothetical protein